MSDLARELLLAAAMAASMVIVHMLGLTSLVRLTQLHIEHFRTPWLQVDRLLVPLTMVMGLFLLHSLEVFAYAALYMGEHTTRAWADALYLSAGAYSTAGWADLHVPDGWRLLAAFEAVNGMLLMGWSTAFLFQTLHRILQTEESHPLPEGAIAEEPAVDEVQDAAADAGIASPRPSRSGSGAP
ncbi:MAG: ion channel [Phenylobacterium sp.]